MTDPEIERDEQIAQLLDDALAELRSGQPIDIAVMQTRHPELAEELPALVDTLRDLDTAVDNWKGVSTATTAEARSPAAPVADGDHLAPAACGDQRDKTIESIREQIGHYRIL